MFLLSRPHPEAVSWHRNAIDAACRTQVQLLVRSSILGAEREWHAEFISAHTTSDRYTEDSGLPYVIVRLNLFLQNIPESTIPAHRRVGNLRRRRRVTPGSAWSMPATSRPWPPSP